MIANAEVEIANRNFDRANALLVNAVNMGQGVARKLSRSGDTQEMIHDDRSLKLTFADVQQGQGKLDMAARERYSIATAYLSEIREVCQLKQR